MLHKQSTQVPNVIFDKYLPSLTVAELKVLLVVIRQTFGWIDLRTGKRKKRDRITQSQFMFKTGLSRRIVSSAIKSLCDRGLIRVTDYEGNVLLTTGERKGKLYLFYSIHPVQNYAVTSAKSVPALVQKSAYNKTNYIKLNKTKLSGVVRGVRIQN